MDGQAKNNRAAWLYGPSAKCTEPPHWKARTTGDSYFSVRPGVGKGTQAELLHDRLGACHLSTGDVFRAATGKNGCEPSSAMKVGLGIHEAGRIGPRFNRLGDGS